VDVYAGLLQRFAQRSIAQRYDGNLAAKPLKRRCERSDDLLGTTDVEIPNYVENPNRTVVILQLHVRIRDRDGPSRSLQWGPLVIISHTHRYLFVELPRTGSTAVRHELRELYDGVPILHKHSTYDEFRRQASPDQLKYFVFSTVRNPLDDAVSRYFKLRTDHRQRFSDITQQKNRRALNSFIDDRMYKYLANSAVDFSTFFLHFYRLPYDTWASLDHKSFDYVMRFERLADDFDKVLRLIGLEPKRMLPARNVTGERTNSFTDYYSARARRRAFHVFGPYMRRWGYEFPSDWGVPPRSTLDEVGYTVFNGLARLYWTHVRPRT
jgi:hypothetical protein